MKLKREKLKERTRREFDWRMGLGFDPVGVTHVIKHACVFATVVVRHAAHAHPSRHLPSRRSPDSNPGRAICYMFGMESMSEQCQNSSLPQPDPKRRKLDGDVAETPQSKGDKTRGGSLDKAKANYVSVNLTTYTSHAEVVHPVSSQASSAYVSSTQN